MNNRKGGLKRGLEHLLGDLGNEVLQNNQPVEALRQISIDNIQPGRYQPRKKFDEDALQELSLSIKEHGVLQPLVIRPLKEGQNYEIIAGERRFRASQMAGLTSVPCVVKNYDDKEALAVALIENLQRSDLNVLEVAQGLQELVEQFSLTHERVAQLVGRSRASVTNTLRLLELSPIVKNALLDNQIEMGHARAMLTLTFAEQEDLLKTILERQLTVRQTEAKVKQSREALKGEIIETGDENFAEICEKLAKNFHCGVSINHKKKGNGKIILKYKNRQELEKILQKWGVKL